MECNDASKSTCAPATKTTASIVRGEGGREATADFGSLQAQAEVAVPFHEQRRLPRCHRTSFAARKGLIRVADVAVFHPEEPSEPIRPAASLSSSKSSHPGDSYSGVTEKLAEYHAWGVPNVWLVDPQLKKLYVYGGGLREVDAFELSSPPLRLTATEIFA